MASTKLTIHIPKESSSENIILLVKLLGNHPDQNFPTVRDLLDFANSYGIIPRTEIQSRATDLGLLTRSDDGISLSVIGQEFVRLKDDVQFDVLHYLFYTGWNESNPLNFLPSWTYRTSCDYYWNRQSVHFDNSFLDQRVEEIINEAEHTFQTLGIADFDGISFSRTSIRSLHNWLEKLNPAVIQMDEFSRRASCHPELLLLSIGFVLQNDSDVTETDFLLTRDKREKICRICLLDSNGFDRTLDWMISIYPEIISPGTTAGPYYGRFVRLHKFPTITDLSR